MTTYKKFWDSEIRDNVYYAFNQAGDPVRVNASIIPQEFESCHGWRFVDYNPFIAVMPQETEKPEPEQPKIEVIDRTEKPKGKGKKKQ